MSNTTVGILEAITRIFVRFGQPAPRIVVDPSKGPSWAPSTNVVTIPAIPQRDLTEAEQTQLRAFFWHEVMGELGNNDYHTRPEIKGNPQRHLLANGIGDGYIDGIILAKRPGAGIDIRTQVALDCQRLLAGGATVTPDVGLAACIARYIVEGVTDWPAVRAALPLCGELLDYIQPTMPTRPSLRSGDDVVALTLRMDAALTRYVNNQPEEEEQDAPEGRPGQSGEEGEETGEAGNISLDKPKGKGKPQPKGDKPEAGDDDGDQSDDEGSDDEGTEADEAGDDDASGEGSDDEGSEEGSEGSEGGSEGETDDEEGEDTEEGSEGSSGASSDEEGDDEEGDSTNGGGSSNGAGDDEGDEGSEGDEEGDSEDGTSRGPGSLKGDGNDKPKRPLELGEDSGERMARDLADMLTGKDENNSKVHARTFHDDLRAVVTGKDIDAYQRQYGAEPEAYQPSPEVKTDASVLLAKLRAALTGPSMANEKGQEYGRLDSRRLSAAVAGSRTVYVRRREIMADNVAVSICFDESLSMRDDGKIIYTKGLVERLSLALGQMPNVVAEFTGWTTGETPAELPGRAQAPQDIRNSLAHTAEPYAMGCTHRVYKSFDEPARALGTRLARIDARGGTPTVEGLAFSARRLAARPEVRKVLFFLTDGLASHEDTSAKMPWGYNALQYEVDKAHKAGITVIVFGVGMDRTANMETEIATANRRRKISPAIKQSIIDNIRATYQREQDNAVKPFGPNATVALLPANGTIIRKVTQSLVDLLSTRTKRIAS